MLGKKNPKKIYLTYNAIYSSPNYRVRMIVVEQLKLFLETLLTEIKPIDKQIAIQVVYMHPGSNWDVDNKAGLWSKVFLDMVKKNKIQDDSVKYIRDVVYSSCYPHEHELIINIYEYENTDGIISYQSFC